MYIFCRKEGTILQIRLMTQFQGMRCRFRTTDINEVAKVTVALESLGVSSMEDLGVNLAQAQQDIRLRNSTQPIVQGTTVFVGGNVGGMTR